MQLREELNSATNELETMRDEQNGVQQQINNTLAEAREIRRQMKLQQPRLQCLRREHELLTEALQRPGGGGGAAANGGVSNGGDGSGSGSLPPPTNGSAFRSSLAGGRSSLSGGYPDPLDALGGLGAAAALTSEQSAALISELAALRESAARDELAAIRENAAASGLLAANGGLRGGLTGGLALGAGLSNNHLSAAAAQGLLGQGAIGDLTQRIGFGGVGASSTAAWLTAGAGASAEANGNGACAE